MPRDRGRCAARASLAGDKAASGSTRTGIAAILGASEVVLSVAAVAALVAVTGIAAAGPRISVLPGGPTVEVDGERFYVLQGERAVRATAQPGGKGARLVVDLVRIGDPTGSGEGAAPVVVTVDGKPNVMPNKPALVPDRRVEGGMIASYPVRYYVEVPHKATAKVEVRLRRGGSGEMAAVKLSMMAGVPVGKMPLASLDQATKRPPKKQPPPAATDASVAPTFARAPPVVFPPAIAPSVVVPPLPVPAPPPVVAAAEPPPKILVVLPAPPTTEEEPPPLPQGRVVVSTKDDMGELFRLRERRVVVDGQVVASESAYGDDTLPRQSVDFDAMLPAGRHEIAVQLVYAGEGGPLFSYLAGYTFHLDVARRVVASPDQVARVLFVAKEQGGMFTELEDRPTIEADVRMEPVDER